jgi:hypothetical protein
MNPNQPARALILMMTLEQFSEQQGKGQVGLHMNQSLDKFNFAFMQTFVLTEEL